MIGKRTAIVIVICFVTATASIAAWGVESSSLTGGTGLVCGSLKSLVIGQVGRLLVLKSELDVTDEQREKTATIVKAHLNEIVPAVTNVLEKRKALREAVMKEDPEEKSIRASALALGQAMGDAAVLASGIVSEVRPVFTPRQVKLVKEFRMSLDNATTDWLNQLGKK